MVHGVSDAGLHAFATRGKHPFSLDVQLSLNSTQDHQAHGVFRNHQARTRPPLEESSEHPCCGLCLKRPIKLSNLIVSRQQYAQFRITQIEDAQNSLHSGAEATRRKEMFDAITTGNVKHLRTPVGVFIGNDNLLDQ